MTTPESEGKPKRKSRRARVIAKVRSLDVLVAGHPDAMADIYESGEILDPTQLGASASDRRMRGRLLSVAPLAEAFMLTKPLVKLASRFDPWRGKRFERGGTAGQDVVLNMQAFRFRCVGGPSELDNKDTLRIDYAGLGNPWPVSLTRSELRRVGETTAIGPAWVGERLLFWWGLDVDAF